MDSSCICHSVPSPPGSLLLIVMGQARRPTNADSLDWHAGFLLPSADLLSNLPSRAAERPHLPTPRVRLSGASRPSISGSPYVMQGSSLVGFSRRVLA